MKHRLLVSTALCAVFAPGAFAADLPTKKGPPPAPVVAPFSWTGIYLGGNLGVVFDPDSVTNLFSNDQTFGSLLPPGRTNTLSPTGILGGVTAGANWEASNFVFGLEGDLDATSAQASFSDNTCDGGGALCWTHSARLSGFADGRLRLGYAFDRFLPFITGGVVYGDISNKFYDSPNDTFGPFTLGRGGAFGWTIGGGGEYALDNHWSIKVQYLYMQFPDVIRTFGVPNGGENYSFKFKDSAQIAEVGVNYRF
jgi:outer membrane immunogenic protein